jgi:hypothetical protein
MYNAEDISSFFDGLISDGVYSYIGNHFSVAPNDLGVTVDTGRAWFNHTWTLNTTILPLALEGANMYWARIDAVVIEVNSTTAVRANTIKVVTGTPAQTPSRPTLIKSGGVYQYPLAYVRVRAGATKVTAADITSMIGTSECPWVVGVVTSVSADEIINQMRAEWSEWYLSNTHDYEEQWNKWFTENPRAYEALWDTWYQNVTSSYAQEMANYRTEQQSRFETWFQGLVDTLDGDVATKLAQQIVDLRTTHENDIDEVKAIIYGDGAEYGIQDSEGNLLIDESDNYILGTVRFNIT